MEKLECIYIDIYIIDNNNFKWIDKLIQIKLYTFGFIK